MVSNLPSGHYHPGASSRRMLDAGKVLKAIGLKEGDIFLDAGSGPGYMSIAASEIVGSKGKVYAVDIDGESVETLKEEVKSRGIRNIETITADITGKTPLASQSIDICLMANVMHGFVENKEVDGVMKEINRVLKPVATLAVVDFKKDASTFRPPVSIRLTPEQETTILTPYHYRKKRVVEVGPYHYAVVFTKE